MKSESQKVKKEANRLKNIAELNKLAAIYGFNVVSFNSGVQYRVNDLLDVYPTNNYYHLLGVERGGFKSIADLFETIFPMKNSDKTLI